MSDISKERSSIIDLGATVVVKKEGELLGQRGTVVDRKQGWYRVQLAGEDGIKSFRWAELTEMEAPSPSPRGGTKSLARSQSSPNPTKKNDLPQSPAAAAATEVLDAGVLSPPRRKGAEGLPPRHPGTASPVAGAGKGTAAPRKATSGLPSPSRDDGGSTASSSAAVSHEQEEEKLDAAATAVGEAVGGEAVVDADSETETEECLGEDGDRFNGSEKAEIGDIEGGDTDVEERYEEEQEQEEEEDEEDEEAIDIDAMIKLAAAAAREHHKTFTLARASGGTAATGGKTASAASAGSERKLVAGNGGGEKAEVIRKRPRLSGVAPRTLDSGLASPKYLQYSGTGKGGNLTASVSSGAVDGGKAAKLMAESALYSGRDRAMLLERTKAPKDDTAGKGWFNMEQAEMTPELKRDLQVIRMRNYVDPKRFYKASDKVSKFMQIGTVQEGPAEYFSSRMTNKERKKTLVDELLVADDAFRAYSKNQYDSIQSRKRAGGKAAYNEQKRKRKGGSSWKP